MAAGSDILPLDGSLDVSKELAAASNFIVTLLNHGRIDIGGVRAFAVLATGPQLRGGSDAVDLMSAASEYDATLIVIPVERLGDGFFDLRTRIAGEIAQKFAMYGRRVAIVGDISHRTAESKSLAGFVLESNRGRDLWFVNNLDELASRLVDAS